MRAAGAGLRGRRRVLQCPVWHHSIAALARAGVAGGEAGRSSSGEQTAGLTTFAKATVVRRSFTRRRKACTTFGKT